MDCKEVYAILRRKNKIGVLAERRSILYGLNKVRYHNRKESLEHFIAKALLTHIIFSKGDGVISEIYMANGRCIDVLKINHQGELIGYEIETDGNFNKEDVEGVDLFEIDLRKMPHKAKEGLEIFKKWMQKQILEG